MQTKIQDLVNRVTAELGRVTTEAQGNDLRVAVLGRSGELTLLLKGMKDVPAELRPSMGKLVNDARVQLEALFDERLDVLHRQRINDELALNRTDITIDRQTVKLGTLHPLMQVRRMIVDYFIACGYSVEDSPEIETEYYNFTALNIPADHPSRDVQDTLYFNDVFLLRSQTSTGQVRTMESTAPPLKMLSPGRVFRADEIDATHTPCFYQIEGLVIDRGITMCDLKGTLDGFAQFIFGGDTLTRFRPSYFPFTEPSVEVDARCGGCKGSGCNICKGTGWIEILGAGMVNKRVLEMSGIESSVYSGFAFGMGLDRITTILHRINSSRVMYENDVRFLRQFEQ